MENSKHVEFGKFQNTPIWEIPKNSNSNTSINVIFEQKFKLLIWEILEIPNFENSKNSKTFQFGKFQKNSNYENFKNF